MAGASKPCVPARVTLAFGQPLPPVANLPGDSNPTRTEQPRTHLGDPIGR